MDPEVRTLAQALIERNEREGRGRRAMLSGGAAVAGVIVATMQVHPLAIATAAGSLPLLTTLVGRATSRKGFVAPLAATLAVALISATGCTVAMADADTPADSAFQRMWLLSVVSGSLVGAAFGHVLGARAAPRLGGLTGRGKPTTPEELVSRRLETLAAATANWSAPTVELRYGTDDKAAVHLDAKLFAARGYDAGKPADPAIRNVLIGLAALATEASGEGTDRVTYRRRV